MSRAIPAVHLLVTQELINRYAEISGDFNPLHVDPLVARRSSFGTTIAHGPIALHAFFIAATSWLGAETLPQGTVVKAVYRSPVRPGDKVVCSILSKESRDGMTNLEAVCAVGDRPAVTITATIPTPP